MCVALVGLALAQALHMAANEPEVGVERALAAAQAAPQQEESYQRVYDAFSRLLASLGNNSLANARRLVSRLNQLVGSSAGAGGGVAPGEAGRPQSIDERTEQILNRLDKVTKDTDQNTLRTLNEDVGRLVGTLNDSYLRNIRRVIERVNKMVGDNSTRPADAHHQSADRLNDPDSKLPGFPGWDEFIVAVDRMQKSLANFVRSSTRLVTSG